MARAPFGAVWYCPVRHANSEDQAQLPISSVISKIANERGRLYNEKYTRCSVCFFCSKHFSPREILTEMRSEMCTVSACRCAPMLKWHLVAVECSCIEFHGTCSAVLKDLCTDGQSNCVTGMGLVTSEMCEVRTLRNVLLPCDDRTSR